MSVLILNDQATPSTPSSTKGKIYQDSADSLPKYMDDAGAVNSIATSLPNYLINGGFDFSQRAAIALTNITSPSTTNRVYSADRWGHTVANVTTPQFQQVDTI